MADLIDRIVGPPGTDVIDVHILTSAYDLYLEGVFTKGEIASYFSLVGQEITDADAIADVIDAKSNVTNKMRYFLKLQAVFLAITDGVPRYWTTFPTTPNKPNIKTDLEIP